jgi:hypothetical protein
MQLFHRTRSSLAAFVVAAISTACAANAAAAGFAPTGGLGEGNGGRFGAAAQLLSNGKVLVAGGIRDVNLATAELYDPLSGLFSATPNNLSEARGYATVTLLLNGKILFATGGDNADGDGASAAADLYDQASGTFSATGSTSVPRHGATANLLDNGKVLVAGGILSNVDTRTATADLYDPATGVFTPTGSMHHARDVAVSVKLPSGKVLIAGGGDGSGFSLDSAELYDPVNGTFSDTGTMVAGRDDATATLLNNGKVLIVGGIDQDVAIGSAELYDPATGMFTASQSSVSPRRFHTATLLDDDTVLIAGGVNSFSNVDTQAGAYIYDPATDTFTATGSMATARFLHTATKLADGRVLVAGGYNDAGVVQTAEIYGDLADEIFGNGFEAP